MNRLTNAIYGKPNSSAPVSHNYNEWLSYDKNGNILKLGRNGISDSSSEIILIDNLDYHYESDHSNILIGVNDKSGNTAGFNKDYLTDFLQDVDYEYDDNGNLVADPVKNISSITYNHLNLPVKITFDGNSQKYIEYIYAATGEKLMKIVKHNDSLSNTRYIHGFQYYDNVLQFFHTPEGYVKNTPNDTGAPSFDYVYQYKDHLGNVRVNYAQDPQGSGLGILDESHYYPFGLQHTNYNSDITKIDRKEELNNEKGFDDTVIPFSPFENPGYKYKYNGKELEEELGKDTYAYGWRDYDPAIGRFNKLDRFSEKYTNYSPYSFAGNNPLIFVDIQGDSIGVGKQYFDRFKNNVEGQIADISSNREERQSKIQSARDKGKDGKVERLERRNARRTQREDGQLTVLNETLSELNAMENSDVLYDIHTNASSSNPNAGGFLGYDTNRNSVTINLVGGYNTGDFAHEFKHGFQFETGRISLFTVNGRSYGGDLYDIQDEVEAYSRGKFFGGTGATTRFIQSNYPSIRNRLEQRTTENTQVTPTVTRNFIISGVPTGLITIPHHYNQN